MTIPSGGYARSDGSHEPGEPTSGEPTSGERTAYESNPREPDNQDEHNNSSNPEPHESSNSRNPRNPRNTSHHEQHDEYDEYDEDLNEEDDEKYWRNAEDTEPQDTEPGHTAPKRTDRSTPRDPSLRRLAFTDARRAYHFPAVILPILLMALATWGTSDGMRDIHGDRPFGALPMLTPAILSVWWAARGAFERSPTPVGVVLRIVSSSLYVPIPLIAGITLSIAGMWLVPANRAMVEGASSHYWWPKILGSQIIKTGTASLGEQMLVTGFMAFLIASFAGLMACIFILLPAVSLRRRGAAFGATLPGQGNSAAYVFLGFAAMVAGGSLLVVFGDGLRFAHVRQWTLAQSHSGWNIGEFDSADWTVVLWCAGLLLIVAGLAVFLRGLYRALRAGDRAPLTHGGYVPRAPEEEHP